jgi:hypothetical protein
MLMGSKIFEFIGEIAYRVPRFSSETSKRVWGEAKFPIILFLKNSRFIDLPWDEFRDRLGFEDSYHMRGNTMKLGNSRILSSGFADEIAFSGWCRSKTP